MAGVASGPKVFSKEFNDLIRAIGECKSKSDEDSIMATEAERLKARLADPNFPRFRRKELLVRLLYLDMLGQDTSWGHIYAVKATHEPGENSLPPGQALEYKKIGYLASNLFLDESHELNVLMINTLQQDMRSDNFLVVAMALSTASKVTDPDTVPALVNSVLDVLQHRREIVRKKAIMCLHKFWIKNPMAVEPFTGKFRQMLCDKDPSVMAAAVIALESLVNENPDDYKRLVPSMVNILKQIIEHRLPKSYNYHKNPAPFIQIRILRILAILGRDDKAASEEMYAILEEVLRKADNNTNIGTAVVYEAVKVASSIYPRPHLLQQCATLVSRLLSSRNSNMKYMGINGLGEIVRSSPQVANEHQSAVIDCLEDADESLKKAALDLLYRMANKQNVDVIVDRMLDYIKSPVSTTSKQDTVSKVVELSERYAPSTKWFISTMNSLFEEAGNLMSPSVAQNVMQLLKEGTGEGRDKDVGLRHSAIQSYMELLQKRRLPILLLELITWTLGEYGVECSGMPALQIMETVESIAKRGKKRSIDAFALTALSKLRARSGEEFPDSAASYIRQMVRATDSELRQRASELEKLRQLGTESIQIAYGPEERFPLSEVDLSLAFLNDYIAEHGVSQSSVEGIPPPVVSGVASAETARAFRPGEPTPSFDAMVAQSGADGKSSDGGPTLISKSEKWKPIQFPASVSAKAESESEARNHQEDGPSLLDSTDAASGDQHQDMLEELGGNVEHVNAEQASSEQNPKNKLNLDALYAAEAQQRQLQYTAQPPASTGMPMPHMVGAAPPPQQYYSVQQGAPPAPTGMPQGNTGESGGQQSFQHKHQQQLRDTSGGQNSQDPFGDLLS